MIILVPVQGCLGKVLLLVQQTVGYQISIMQDSAHRRQSVGDTSSHLSRSSFMSADALESFSSGRASDPPIPSDVGPDPEPEPTVTTVMTNVGPGDKGGARRLDWKLDAEELSLIRREERVMKPDVLARLLSAGAKLDCEKQLALLLFVPELV